MAKIGAKEWLKVQYDSGFDSGMAQRRKEERDQGAYGSDFIPQSMSRLEHNESTWLGFHGFCDGYFLRKKRDYTIID